MAEFVMGVKDIAILREEGLKKYKKGMSKITCEDVPIRNHEVTHAWIT